MTINHLFLMIALCFLFPGKALAEKRVLQPQDFTYRGVVRMPAGMGQYMEGLAYRRSTNTYFTIGFAGQNPFRLFEISLPAPSATIESANKNRATIVKEWGALNVNGRLNVLGELVRMKGLYWDEDKNRLWFAFGSYYASKINNPVLGFATLDPVAGVTIHGPWMVAPSTHSDTVKGMIVEAPPSLRAITGHRFMMFGDRGSVGQLQSWGPGLVSVAEPQPGQTPLSELAATRLIHWPMKVYGKFLNSYPAYSDFPRLSFDHTTTIIGNDNVSKTFSGIAQAGGPSTITLQANVDYRPARGGFPNNTLGGGSYYVTNLQTQEQIAIATWDNVTKVATLSRNWSFGNPRRGTPYSVVLSTYQDNIMIPPDGKYRATDAINHAAWIDLPNKHGLVYFGATALGYSWYGNSKAHVDATENGILRNNNLNSLLDPSKKLTSISTARGGHTEANAGRFYIINPNSVLAIADKAKRGVVTQSDRELSWSWAGSVTNLGVSTGQKVQLQRPSFGDMSFDPHSGKLSVICPGGWNESAIINVWEINPN